MKHGKRMSFRIIAFILIMAMMSGTMTTAYALEGISCLWIFSSFSLASKLFFVQSVPAVPAILR